MHNTAENVRVYAEEAGLEPVQIDGIPEGFSFKYPNVEINNKLIKRGYIAFIPLRDDSHKTARVYGETKKELLTAYEVTTREK